MALTISDELKSLMPPLSPEERFQLEANILNEGCRDPLIVWKEEQILLDGHHRFAICERHGLTYTIQELTLPDMDAAKGWMIANQLGRRNLSPDQMAYYRGEQYNLQKR
jgi:ParB-like chromosome segregation protein Spo0J